jgi:hypothetical protein
MRGQLSCPVLLFVLGTVLEVFKRGGTKHVMLIKLIVDPES